MLKITAESCSATACTVPYSMLEPINRVPTMIDEFERYTNKEVVASVFENYAIVGRSWQMALRNSGQSMIPHETLPTPLDNERNRIERMELYLSMGGLSFAMMSAVGGFFGMNLLSGLEDHPKKFWIVTYVTLITSASLWYVTWQRFHLGRQIQHQQVSGFVGTLRRAVVPQLPPGFF